MASDKIKRKPTYTIEDAKSLWGRSVSADASPGMSIGPDRGRAPSVAAAKLLLRARRLGKAGEEPADPKKRSDFEIIKLLGKGGMGMVYSARQASLDRNIAVKMIKPESAKDPKNKSEFLAEAIVTGDLEHPNIVPVHDLGGTSDGLLFYAMKEVKGASWAAVIKKKSESENLEILLKACDAMAFAHDRGVIHRDLKPENVMLGDYGEVLVTDWGLAAKAAGAEGSSKAAQLTEATGRSGTPAYMAPEMARCDLARIGPASDVYLLGGILYEIVTGLRPHPPGSNVYACLYAAMQNKIQPTEKQGELVEIALKAMATEPEARYASVKDFQQAIRDYETHAESLKLSAAADERLARLKDVDPAEIYRECTEIIAGYQQALDLWRGNDPAICGLRSARQSLVETALAHGDLALARSQVAAMEDECGRHKTGREPLKSLVELTDRVYTAIAQAQRQARIARLSRRGVIAAGIVIVLGSVAATIAISNALSRAKSERDRAVQAEKHIRQERDRTIAAQKAAEIARSHEVAQRHRADKASQRSQEDNYANTIRQAQRRIAGCQLDAAIDLLWATPKELRNWEWGRAMRLCHPVLNALDGFPPPVFSSDGKRLVVRTGPDRRVKILDTKTGRELAVIGRHIKNVTAIAISSNGRRVATTSRHGADATVRIWDVETGLEIDKLTLSHKRRPRSIAFIRNGKALTIASHDGALNVWIPDHLTFEGHAGFVSCVALSADGTRLVTGSADGTAKIWDAESARELLTLKGHCGGVSCVALSPDSKRVLAGHGWTSSSMIRKNHTIVKAWDVESGKELSGLWRGQRVLDLAVSPDGNRVATALFHSPYPPRPTIWDIQTWRELRELGTGRQMTQCVVFSPDGKCIATGDIAGVVTIWDAAGGQQLMRLSRHADAVASLAFSPDGKRIVTGSQDCTANIWDVKTGALLATLKGHGKIVRSVAFSPDGKRIATGSNDGMVRLWDVADAREMMAFEAHSGGVSSVVFCTDGLRLVSAGADKTAKIWDAFDWTISPQRLEKLKRERYKLWLEKNR